MKLLQSQTLPKTTQQMHEHGFYTYNHSIKTTRRQRVYSEQMEHYATKPTSYNFYKDQDVATPRKKLETSSCNGSDQLIH